jgi:predicted LPLAT superfamily acyltransferase
MSSWKGKTRGGILGYQIFVFILRKLGVKPAYLLLRFVVIYFALFAPKASVAIFNYFRQAHHFNFLKSLGAGIKNYFVFGQTIIDKIVLMAGIRNSFTYSFIGEEHLMKIRSMNKGGILIGAHVGSWEIAGHLLERLDSKVHIVMFEAEHEQIKKYLSNVMGERNWNVIPIKNDLSHIFEIKNALARNEIICIHGDRFIDGAKVSEERFLGKNALFPMGPFMMAAKLGAPYSFVHCVKTTANHYDLYATPVSEKQQNTSEVLKDYVKSLEDIVTKYPYQWFNYYDFWKTGRPK